MLRSVAPLALLLAAAGPQVAAGDEASSGGVLGLTPAAAGPWRVSRAGDGTLSWELASDAGAPAPVVTTVVIDGDGPELSWRWSGPTQQVDAGLAVGAGAVPTVESSDPAGAMITVWTPANASGDGFLAPLPPGQQELAVVAVDGLRNRTEQRRAVIVDNEGPRIMSELLSAITGTPGYSSRPARVAVWAVDDEVGSRLLAPEEGRADSRASARTFTTRDRSIEVLAVDDLGNQTRRALSWTYDELAPSVSVAFGGERYEPGATLRISAGDAVGFDVADEGVGVAAASYRYNRNPARPVPSTLRFLDRGRYRLIVRAEDHEGNAATYRWNVLAR